MSLVPYTTEEQQLMRRAHILHVEGSEGIESEKKMGEGDFCVPKPAPCSIDGSACYVNGGPCVACEDPALE